MICRLHDDILSLLLFFSTLSMSILLLYFAQLPLHLDVLGEQDSVYLNVKHAELQNSIAYNSVTMATAIATNTSISNINPKTTTTANATATGNIIEKLSDKGMYRVQLRSNESFNFLPKNGFNIQMLFLNASRTSAQSSTTTSQMKQLVPVSGFDMTIYSNNGKVLWQKTNQTINAATAFENVTLTNGGYIGGITIQVTNIKPSSVPIGTAIPLLSGSNNNNNSNSAILGPTTMNGKTPTDSVTFTASIVK
jgi:hypothetical protein